MDFWDNLFDSEYKRRADIDALKQSQRKRRVMARHELRKSEAQDKRIEQLEDQVGELALLCRSLLTVLRENGVVEPEQFEKVLNLIDAEDGRIDGKITHQEPPDDPEAFSEIQTW